MTYVTGFFLVFAGMLIGYFLWYRDRSEDEQQRLMLDRENSDLRNALQIAQTSHSTLEERFTRQKGQLNVLQQLCDDWSTTREQSERDRAQLEVEAEDKRKKYEAAIGELQTAKQKQIELEDHIHSLNQSAIKRSGQQEKEWHKKYSTLESGLTQRQLELKSAVTENERLSKSLHQAEAKIAGLQSEMESNRKLLETATKNAGGLKQEYVSLESSLKENSHLLASARAEGAAALSERNQVVASLNGLKKQHQQLQTEAETLRAQIAQLSTTQAEATALQQALKNNQDQLIKVTKQRDLALNAEKTSITMASGWQQRIDNQESTIHGLREKHKDALESAKLELGNRTELESAFEKHSFELKSRLTEQTKHLAIHTKELDSKFSLKTTALEKQLANQTQTISELQRTRDQLTAELSDAQTKRKSASDHLARLQAESDQLQKESAVAAQQTAALQQTSQRVTELETALAQHQEKQQADTEKLQVQSVYVEELESELSRQDTLSGELDTELTRLRGEYKTVYASHAELQSKIDNNSVNRDEFEGFKLEYQSQISGLQAKLKSSEETIRSLRRERAGVLARLANYRTVAEPDATVISFKQAMEERKQQQPKDYCDEYGGHTETHSVRGVIYTSEPESRDDLKRISGIAEVLEARLNDYGIYTYKQIMDWQPEAIEEFSRLLAFRDRIVRDDWQGQAKFFYERKHQQQRVAA
jgi:predicted flap endonuclease-1-like 5' DNA nuclease